MFAQNVWTGSSSGVINVSGNYQAGASVANDGNPSAAFVFGRVASTNRTITLPGEFKANQLQFESNGGGGFTLSGSFLNFIGGSNGIFQNSSQAVTISSGIKVSDGPLTLGGTGTGLITLSGSSGNDFGGKGITKSGTSAFLITQSLTNTGTLNINGGTLAFSGTGNIARAYQLRGGVVATSGTFSRALGTTATNVNFGAGGGGFAAYGGALTVSTALGTWASTANSLANNTSLILGSNIANNVVTLSSNLNLNAAARTIQLVDNANSADDWSVMSGILSNGGLTITGSGRLVLSGTNTFTGVTSINGGTLSVATIGNGGTAGNLGQAAVAAGNLVLGGGTLQYTGATASTDRSFTLTAATSSSIHVTEAANALTISGASANTTGALTKTGAGTLILSGLNLHTGLTTVSNGTLRYGITNALSSGGVTVSGGTLDIATFNDTVGAVSVESGSITGTTGALTGTSYDLQSGTVSAILDGAGALTKISAGNVTLSGANNYSGATSITGGALNIRNATALGTTAGNTTVSSGAALELQGDISVGAEALTLSGTGVSNAGALRNISGANTYGGLLSLGAASRINSDAGTLTLSNAGTITGATFGLTVGGAGNTTINSIIGTTSGTLTKDETGTLILTGANTFTGLTSITGGVLNIRNASALGTTAGATFVSSGAALELQGDISVGAEALTLSGTGVSNAGALRNISGANTYGGLLSLGAASRINSDAGTLTLSNAGTITGATFGLTVGGAGNTTINSIIGTTSGTLTKDETGTLILTAANTFTGLTSITGGVLNMRNASALGTTAGATFVSSGAALELQGGLTIGAEALTLNGSGVSSGGALRSVSGTNSFGGAITADSASTITADAGSLTLSSTLNSAFATTFGGAGNIIMAGSLSGVGNIIKSGNGALTLAAGNSQANTTVNAGQLNVNHLAALGTPAGTLTMASGTSLDNTSGASVTVTNPKSINLGSSLTFVGSNNLNLGNGLVTLSGNTEINVAANQLTFGGDLLGSGNIEKTGAGILALGGFSADYSGIITMSAGDLMLTAANILNKAVINQTGGKVIIGGGTPQERLEVFLPKISGSGGEILVGSDTVAVFNSDDDLDDGISQSYSGRIRGSGGIRKQGSGLVTLNGKNDFTGQADIDGGTLLIHEECELGGPAVIANNAVLVVNGATSGTVEVEAGGTLAGAGVVGGFVIIKGIHSPGNSPGVQTFANGASYDGTSVFEWDLVKNFSNPTGRGTFYDGVNVTAGQLLIAADSQSSLRFNREGSTVNWSNSFWTTDQQWLVFDNASAPSEIFGAPSLTVDSEGATLASLRPGATFSWGQVGNDIYLNYTVPEPSSALFTIAGVLGLSLRRRR
jgi:autotransporter-associated beta strand protein